MAASGGSWVKGKFYPAEGQVTAKPPPKKVSKMELSAPAATVKRTEDGKDPRLDEKSRRAMRAGAATQGGLFQSGEDTPLFSGQAQKGEIKAFKKQQQARQANFAGMGANKGYQSQREQYTRRYWKIKEDAKLDETYAKELETQGNDYEAYQVRNEYKGKLRRERELSIAARERGYNPHEMTKRDWDNLAEELKTEAKEALENTTEHELEGAAQKFRGGGGKKEWMQVGGEDKLVTIGANSRRDAQKYKRELQKDVRDEADDYMTEKLSGFGFEKETVKGLNYNQKRTLLAELGEGGLKQTKSGRASTIGGISAEKRKSIILSLTENDRRDARSQARSPETAKGLDIWERYIWAKENAGKEPTYVPRQATQEEFYTPTYVGHRKRAGAAEFKSVLPKPKKVDMDAAPF